MELIDLKAEIREGNGKIAARALRKNNSLPAVLYGGKTETLSISVNTQLLKEIIRKNGSSGLFINLEIDGDSKASRTVLLKDTQMNTFRTDYLHADFQEVDMETKIVVTVPVETTGESIGVKEGGFLQIIRRELDLLCRPGDTPDSILVDISALEVGDAVHVEDLVLPEGIEVPHEVDFTVITVIPPVTSGSDSDGEVEDDVEDDDVE